MTTSELFQLEPCRAPLSPYPTILAKGFRIFFLCAGFAAAILIPLWLLMLEGHFVAPTRFAPAAWHGHEMAFGYAFAVVGGFLLTAVYNWVGQPHLNGWKLALLALLWLLGRVAMLASGLLPAWLVALVDASFLPVLAAVLTPPLIKARKWPNLGFMFLLLLAGGYNLAFHLDAADIVEAGGSNALLTSVVEILVLFVVILTGRVMVMFTENGIPGTKTRQLKWVERLALPSAVLFILADLLPFAWSSAAAAYLAFAAALVHALRLSGWRTLKTFRSPLVWVLHLGYAGLIAGMTLKGLSNLGLLPSSMALHAFTVATLGPVTLGMMARIGLGHTGRTIAVPGRMALAFALVLVAGIVRVAAPLLPLAYDIPVLLSGLAWTIAFAIFTFGYLPILTSPRVDGQPG